MADPIPIADLRRCVATLRSGRRLHVLIFLGFLALALVVTYPQARCFTTCVPPHMDPYFSMWRLGWVAHQIVHDPAHLFEANIFVPEHDTLAYSDAMILPGVALAPLFWLGANPVATYNGALLVALALSGLTAFVLARRLTGNVMAGVIAGMIYAFAPFRFTHYVHLEVQLVFWMPLALLLIHKIACEGRIRDGAWLGLVMAAQVHSTVYGAVFLGTYCTLFVALLLILQPPSSLKRVGASLLMATTLTVALSAPYATVYARAARRVGNRAEVEVSAYSASLRDYLHAPASNRLYGRTAVTDPIWSDEMNLFPGIVALSLAAFGVALGADRRRLVYVGGLLFAFDLSRGLHGVAYPFLYHYVAPFRGLRAAARVDILLTLSLAMLAAYGASSLLAVIPRSLWRRVSLGVTVIALITEYASRPPLAVATFPTDVDRWLAKQPSVVILELPLEAEGVRASPNSVYMFQSIGHFQRMLNGYSGFTPPSYAHMRQVMENFPDDRSLELLRERHVSFVVLRGDQYRRNEWPDLMARLAVRTDISLAATFSAGNHPEMVYAVRR
jgi:hypothetical protein